MLNNIYYLKYKKYYTKYINLKNELIQKGGGNMKIVLEKANMKQLYYLLPIVSDINVMKYIKRGNVWSKEYLENELKWWSYDWKNKDKAVKFWWAVKVKSSEINHPKDIPVTKDGFVYVGMIGIHKSPGLAEKNKFYKDKYFITRFLGTWSQGLGIGTKMLELAIKDIVKEKLDIKNIYSMSLESNIKAHKSSEKNGFKKDGNITFNNKEYYIFTRKIEI